MTIASAIGPSFSAWLTIRRRSTSEKPFAASGWVATSVRWSAGLRTIPSASAAQLKKGLLA